MAEREAGGRDAESADAEELRASEWNATGLQVEKKIVRAGGRESTVVREAEVLVLDGLEDERNTGRENGILEPAMLVQARGGGKLELISYVRDRVDVAAVFGDVVIGLVAAVDCAFRLRHRVDVVVTEQKALFRTDAEAVLHLCRKLRRLVDDAGGIAAIRAARGRLHGVQQKRLAGVACVEEDLAEQLIDAATKLVGLVDPVLYLGGTKPGGLDSAAGLAPAVVGDDLAGGGRTEVGSDLTTLPVHVTVARLALGDRVGRKEVPFLRVEHVICRLESEFRSRSPGGAE